MSSAEDWARALESGKGRFTLNFERMGVEAECRTLSAAEVEECRRMGGERGIPSVRRAEAAHCHCRGHRPGAKVHRLG